MPLMTQSASEVQVRRATADDAALVASVLRQAFAEYEPLYTEQGYAATTPGAGEIAARIGHGPVWVAVYREQIVGTGSVVAKPEGIYIRGMAVIPSARGLGIGRRLLDEIQRFAIAQGCTRLFLSTTPFLNTAIRLYEAFGFRRTNDGPHDLFGTPLFTMEKTVDLVIEEERRNSDLSDTAGERCIRPLLDKRGVSGRTSMRVFVAGADGAFGTQVVGHLVADRHEVIGFTRSAAHAQVVQQLGASRSITGDALDPSAPLWSPPGRTLSFTPLRRFENGGRGVLLIWSKRTNCGSGEQSSSLMRPLRSVPDG